MSEPAIVATSTEDAAELITLRRVNAELLTKSSTRKARVLELEASLAELQAKFDGEVANVHSLTVEGPLQAMADSISNNDEFFLATFAKSYKVEMVKGLLTLLTTDGKPVLSKTGKVVPFEREALLSLLRAEDHPQAKAYGTILIGSRASGSGKPVGRSASAEPKRVTLDFGLR